MQRRPRRPQPQRYNSMLLDVPPDSNHGEEMSSSCVRIVDNEKDNDHVNPKNDAAHISQQSQQSPDVRLPPSNESIHQLPLFGLSQVNFAPISGLAPEMPPPGSVFASSSTEENSPGLKRCSTNLVDNRESQADENPATPVQHITSTGIVSHSSPLNIHTYVSSSDFDPTKLSRAPQEHKCTHKSSKLDLHLQSSPPPPTRTPPSTPEIFHHKPFFPSECLSDDQTPMQGDKLSCHVGKRPKIPKLNIPIEADGMKEPLAHSPILVSNIIPESTHMPIKLIDYENSYQSLNTQNLGITMGCIRPQPTDLAQHESLPSANRPQNFLNLKGGESELRDTVRRKYFIRMPSLPRLSTRKKSSKILAIFYAAETGNAEALKQLLETTSDANSRNQQSRTPQMQAAMYGRLNCLQILKDHNANELAVDQDGRTVMHIATLMNQTGVVTWLLKTYSVPTHDAPRQSSRLARISGNIIGRPSLRLHETSDMEGYKALHLAVKANLERMVRLLVEFGLEINSRTNLGRTPLHEAVILNNKDISALLITNGADIHIADSNTMSPLHWAAVLGHRESVALLLANNADKSRYDGDGDLPIHKAAWSRHLALFDEFVGERADLELKTRTGESLLHIACLRDDLELAQYLLRHDVNANSWAAPNHPRTSNVHNIALQRRNPPSRPKAFSRTPLHCSCMHGHFAMVSLLLDHGAQANAALENGMTPLMMAVENEDADLVSLLLAHNANVNAADRVRRTALHIACARGDLKTVRELIRHGADVNAKSRDRLRPLEYAIVVVGYDPVFFDRLTLIIDYFVTLDQKNLKIANNFLRSRSSSSF